MPNPKLLLGKVATRPNLQGAWEDISRSARPFSHGISGQTIQDFRANWKSNIESIRHDLLSEAYRFGQVRAATTKKKGGKKRPLRIADIRDRVVQRAITRVLDRKLSKKFKLDNRASYAYLPGKGTRSAIKQMLQYHQDGCRFILEADIMDFFGTVNTSKLLHDLIFPNLADTTINALIEAAFQMEVGNLHDLPEEDWELYPESSVGLPQGGYLSPLFSNIYLSEFDQRMLKEKFRLIRYADDFIVMCKTQNEAEGAYDLSRKFLEDELGLKLHYRDDNDKLARTRIVRVSQKPILFLGIQFNGLRIWPSKNKRRNLIYKLDQVGRESRNVLELLTSMKNLIAGWIAAYGFTDLDSSYVVSIDNEVNKCLWKALKKLKWNISREPVSDEQRINSGVDPVNSYLMRVRKGLKDQDLFSKYWT